MSDTTIDCPLCLGDGRGIETDGLVWVHAPGACEHCQGGGKVVLVDGDGIEMEERLNRRIRRGYSDEFTENLGHEIPAFAVRKAIQLGFGVQTTRGPAGSWVVEVFSDDEPVRYLWVRSPVTDRLRFRFGFNGFEMLPLSTLFERQPA